MKQFDYTAQCENMAAISGTIEAGDADDAMKQLLLMRLTNIDLDEVKPRPLRRTISREDFIFFNEQLASLAKTGICLDAGLRQLAKDIHSRRLRRVIEEIAADVETGVPLDKALDKHTERLPRLYARVVKAGLESGQLSATLLNLSQHLRLVSETRRLIIDALAYPCIVLCLAVALMGAVMGLLVPEFEQIFLDFDAQLPGMTMAMINLSHAMPGLLLTVGVVVGAVVLAYLLTRASPAGRALREQLLFAVPLLGRIVQNSIRSSFLRAMAFLVNAGIPLPEALRLSADATASPAAVRDAERLAGEVEGGRSVFQACQTTSLVPPMLGYVLEVGSDRDDLKHGLVELSKTFESRAVHGQSLLRGWLAPLAVIVLGGMIAVFILALFLPFVQLIESVSGF